MNSKIFQNEVHTETILHACQVPSLTITQRMFRSDNSQTISHAQSHEPKPIFPQTPTTTIEIHHLERSRPPFN